ncbi:MAG: response regulator [Nitrospirae bacterium]|nr:response regulator [Nitrospirota bacterium]
MEKGPKISAPEIPLNEALAELHKGEERSKILYVDDSRSIREMARIFMSHCIPGYEVVTARGGFDALDQISTGLGEEVVVIISDVNMPEMDGIQLACALKSKDGQRAYDGTSLNNVPFIVCSGNSGNYQIPGTIDYRLMQTLKERGFVDAVMGKPFEVPTVRKTVRRAIENVMNRNSGGYQISE